MRVSIEWFLLDNWLMNAAALLLASALCGLRPRRRLWALLCLLGAIYALVAMAAWPTLLVLPFRLLAGGVIALGLRFDGWRGFMRAYFSVLISAMLLGGLLFALSLLESGAGGAYGFVNGMLVGTVRMRILLIFIPLAALTPRFLRSVRSMARVAGQTVRVRITLNGKTMECRALIDTGNLLVEPLSGLPVVLVNDCPRIEKGYPVQYGGAGGGGELQAMRADRAQLRIQGVWREMDVMVAHAPQRIQHADAILGSIALPADLPINAEGGNTGCVD